MARLISIAVILSLAVPLTVSQSAQAAGKKQAKLRGSFDSSNGLFKAVSVYPYKVDGKRITGLFKSPPYDVPAGKHRFVLTTKFSTGFLSGKYEGSGTVTATLRAGRLYKTVGKAKGKSLRLWIVDARTGKRVSTVGRAKVYNCPAVLMVCN